MKPRTTTILIIAMFTSLSLVDCTKDPQIEDNTSEKKDSVIVNNDDKEIVFAFDSDGWPCRKQQGAVAPLLTTEQFKGLMVGRSFSDRNSYLIAADGKVDFNKRFITTLVGASSMTYKFLDNDSVVISNDAVEPGIDVGHSSYNSAYSYVPSSNTLYIGGKKAFVLLDVIKGETEDAVTIHSVCNIVFDYYDPVTPVYCYTVLDVK